MAAQAKKVDEQELMIHLLEDLRAVDLELSHREAIGNPLWYGLPDLLFGRNEMPSEPRTPSRTESVLGEIDGADVALVVPERKKLPNAETEEEYRARQNAALREFVETRLWVTKDMKRISIRMIPEQLAFVADIFFRRVRRVILWKARGAGGSLSAAIAIWLLMVYRQSSVLDVAGGGEQAQVIYRYVTGFFDGFPEMRGKLLARPPTITETKLSTGVFLKAIPATEKQARGKHVANLFGDESCSGDENADRSLRAAMSGVASEEDSLVVLLSTFHVPSGLFAEHWDFATEKGFARYKWDAFSTMQKCARGMDRATPEDPKALAACRECPLSWKTDIRDERGRVVDQRLEGCAGKARDSEGWASFESLLDMRRMHAGTNVFEVEFSCFLPGTLVITENGLEKIEEIAPGTKVLTHLGNWRAAWPMRRFYRGKVVRLSGQGGPDVVMTPEHPVFHAHGKKTGWVEARHFLKKRYATYLPAVGERMAPELEELLCPVGGPGVRAPVAMALPRGGAFARTLGRVLGDGYVEYRRGEPAYVGLSGVGNAPLFESFSEDVAGLFDRQVSERGDHETLAVFGHKALASWLVRECGRYCPEKHLPPRLFQSMTVEEDKEFLRGYAETDGCVREDGIRFISTSPGLAGQTLVILLRNGFAASVRVGVPSNPGFESKRALYVVGVYGGARDELACFLGKSCGVRSTRAHIRHVGDWVMYPRRNATEEEYAGTVYNLDVDDDRSYCLPGMAVHNCLRPNWMRTVYDAELVDKTDIGEIEVDLAMPKAAGIDWGYETAGSMALVLGVKCPDYVGVPESVLTDHVQVRDVIEQLKTWRETYGPFVVFADKSHPFNNAELSQAGFDVEIVDFGTMKSLGIQNVQRYLACRRLRILTEFRAGREQMKGLRRNERGAIVKKDDHFCDALLAMLLAFRFDEHWPSDMGREEQAKEPVREPAVRGLATTEVSADGRVILI